MFFAIGLVDLIEIGFSDASYMTGEDEDNVTLIVTATGYPEGVSIETYVLLYTRDGSALGEVAHLSSSCVTRTFVILCNFTCATSCPL